MKKRVNVRELINDLLDSNLDYAGTAKKYGVTESSMLYSLTERKNIAILLEILTARREAERAKAQQEREKQQTEKGTQENEQENRQTN